jgi:hypothetical protein
VTWGRGGKIQICIDVKKQAIKVCICNILANSWSWSSIVIQYINWLCHVSTCFSFEFLPQFTLCSACPYDHMSSLRNICQATSVGLLWSQSNNAAPKKRKSVQRNLFLKCSLKRNPQPLATHKVLSACSLSQTISYRETIVKVIIILH